MYSRMCDQRKKNLADSEIGAKALWNAAARKSLKNS